MKTSQHILISSWQQHLFQTISVCASTHHLAVFLWNNVNTCHREGMVWECHAMPTAAMVREVPVATCTILSECDSVTDMFICMTCLFLSSPGALATTCLLWNIIWIFLKNNEYFYFISLESVVEIFFLRVNVCKWIDMWTSVFSPWASSIPRL